MGKIGNVEYRRIDTKYLVPETPADFLDTGIVALLDSLSFGPNLILKGAKGAGKTLGIEAWAAKLGVPLLRFSCTEETGMRDLLGTFVPEGGAKVFFQLGVLSAAIDIANDEGACVVVLEEINTLPPQVQKALNSMTDYRQAIELPKIGVVFKALPGRKVWLLGTMNPNYAGTYSLNEDLRSRFQFIDITYMSPEQEKELLEKQFPSVMSVSERDVVRRIVTFGGESRGGQFGYALSTRDLVDFIRLYIRLGYKLPKALKLLEGKFEKEHLANVQARFASIFSVDTSKESLY